MSLKFAILTVSDRSFAGTREDLSGPVLADAVRRAGWAVSATAIIPDEGQTNIRPIDQVGRFR